MNMMMFPRMMSSHDEGWAWLMQVHPSVTRTFCCYVVPMSLLPPAMLLYAAANHSTLLLANMSMNEAWRLAIFFFIAELLMVPLMGAVIQFIGQAAQMRPDYHDAFVFAAVAPTPLWLSSLALFVPSLMFNGIVTAVALCACGMLIYEGSFRLFKLDNERRPIGHALGILSMGLLAWACMMMMAYRIIAWLE